MHACIVIIVRHLHEMCANGAYTNVKVGTSTDGRIENEQIMQIAVGLSVLYVYIIATNVVPQTSWYARLLAFHSVCVCVTDTGAKELKFNMVAAHGLTYI